MPQTTTNTAAGNLESGMKLALLGIVINAALSVIKLAAGYFGNSYALIADGIESMLDIAGSFIIWGGLKLASKPADADHPYGHGKAEPMAGIIVALFVLAAAAGLAVESVREILTPHHAPASFTLIVLIVVVIVKESLYRVVMWHGNRSGSTAIKTDAGHHRADVLTSIAAFIGISIALIGGPGWEQADDWAALFACVLIAYNGVKLLKPGLAEIMDTAPSKEVQDAIRGVAASVPGVENVERCNIRKMGVEFYVDLHVWVDGDMSVHEGHRIAHEVKDAVKESNPAVADVLVHIEPRRPVTNDRKENLKESLRITGWHPRWKKMESIIAIRQASGLDLAEAKTIINSVLTGNIPEFFVDGYEKSVKAAQRLAELGAIVAHREKIHDHYKDDERGVPFNWNIAGRLFVTKIDQGKDTKTYKGKLIDGSIPEAFELYIPMHESLCFLIETKIIHRSADEIEFEIQNNDPEEYRILNELVCDTEIDIHRKTD